jgi:hypothetical protein
MKGIEMNYTSAFEGRQYYCSCSTEGLTFSKHDLVHAQCFENVITGRLKMLAFIVCNTTHSQQTAQHVKRARPTLTPF